MATMNASTDEVRDNLLRKVESLLYGGSGSQLALPIDSSEGRSKRLTKRRLCSLKLNQLIGLYRELYPNEGYYDPGYGCRTEEQRKRAYADVIYNHLRY